MHIFNDDEDGVGEEQPIHQHPRELQDQDSIELGATGHKPGSHMEECSVTLDLEEHMPAFDEFEPETDKTAAAAHAHAQVILNAYNGNQFMQIAGTEDEDKPLPEAHIESLHITQEYMCLIQNATLDEDKLDSETLDHLQDSIEETLEIIDPDERLLLGLFTATNFSKATYNQCCSAILWHYQESGILTFYKVKQLVANISGIVPVMDNMCINSCHAFTGPFADIDAALFANQLAKHGKKVPQQQACTFPLGLQI
ncbi:hypothetical protein C0989_005687 [Termitomyces sp. Mn162]|nr:hypothetical protein C0989_005687 [Termitomyces sp. Mn162]